MNIHSLNPPYFVDPRTTYINKPALIYLGGKDVLKVEIEWHLSICKSQGVCITQGRTVPASRLVLKRTLDTSNAT
jgi:hypothetical protein